MRSIAIKLQIPATEVPFLPSCTGIHISASEIKLVRSLPVLLFSSRVFVPRAKAMSTNTTRSALLPDVTRTDTNLDATPVAPLHKTQAQFRSSSPNTNYERSFSAVPTSRTDDKVNATSVRHVSHITLPHSNTSST